MPRDDDRLVRQLSLVSLLLSRGRPVSAHEIRTSAEGYAMMSDQAFPRRFYDDREELRTAGIIIDAQKDESGETEVYLLSEAGYLLPDLAFTPEEVRALVLAFALLHDRFAYARPLRLALVSLTRGQVDLALSHEDTATVALDEDEEAGRLGGMLARLDDSCVRGKTVRFRYCTAANVEGERIVDPYSMVRIAAHWYVVGRDHDRDDVRMFRLSRIRGPVVFASKKARDFQIPDDFDPAEYRARPAWLLGPAQGTARVRVDGELAWWVQRSFPCVALEGEGDGSDQVFNTPYADPAAIAAWIMRLGRRGEILEPVDLRQFVAERLEAIRAAHTGEPPEATADGPSSATTGPPPPPRAATSATAPVPPERLSRVLSLLAYLLEPARGDRVPLATVERDLGLTRGEVKEDAKLLNLVTHGGGTYLLFATVEKDAIRIDREPDGEVMAGPARLSPLMARALLLALDLVGDTFPASARDALDSARSKVQKLVGGRGVPARVTVEGLVPMQQPIFDVLTKALDTHAVVRLEYYTPTREALWAREVEPYFLHQSVGVWYLEAYCRRAEAMRTFRLDLIRTASLSEERFTPRPGADDGTHDSIPARVASSSSQWAWIAFPAEQLPLLQEQGLETRLQDGEVRARIPYLDERWLVLEIMRHLGKAVLIEPLELRVRVAATAEDLRTRYATPDE